MFVHIVKMINDPSERSIKLIQDFSNDETQKQYLLLVIEHHRKVIPNFNKETNEMNNL